MGWLPETGTNISGLEGSLGQVRLWSTARTQEQIQNNLNLELNGDEAGLEMLLKFSEASGRVTSDATVNANDATLVSKNPQGISGRIQPRHQSRV